MRESLATMRNVIDLTVWSQVTRSSGVCTTGTLQPPTTQSSINHVHVAAPLETAFAHPEPGTP